MLFFSLERRFLRFRGDVMRFVLFFFLECAMQHLAAHDQQESYWSGPDPNKLNTVGNNNKQHTHTHTRPSRKAEKAKGTSS
jgi:polyhydroxyalkanoate synthesis regulator protein